MVCVIVEVFVVIFADLFSDLFDRTLTDDWTTDLEGSALEVLSGVLALPIAEDSYDEFAQIACARCCARSAGCCC